MKNALILFLILLTTISYCQQLEFISPSTDEEVAGIIPVKVKVISQNKNDIPLLQVIEATEEALSPEHPKVDFIEIPDPIIDTQESKGNNIITTYVYKWDTCHLPTPLDKSIVNSHNGKHTLKLTLGDKSITENVTLNNLTIKVSPDKIFNLIDLGEDYEDDIIIKPQPITVNIDGKNTDKPYNLIINIYHKEAPFAGIRNKNGENLNKPIMTFTLENVTGKTQTITWKGESTLDKEIIAKGNKITALIEELKQKYPDSNTINTSQLTEEEKELLEEFVNSYSHYKSIDYYPNLISSEDNSFNNRLDINSKINIEFNEDILEKQKEYGMIINSPQDLTIINKNFDYTILDWTKIANNYNFSSETYYDNGKAGCFPGPYIIQAIIAQNTSCNTNINGKTYNWNTVDNNQSNSEYLFTELDTYDNGSFIYHLEDFDETEEKEIETLNLDIEKVEDYYDNIISNIYKESEEIFREKINSNPSISEEELSEFALNNEKARKEKIQSINKERNNKLHELTKFTGSIHSYKLTDLKNNKASEIYINIGLDGYQENPSIYKLEYDKGTNKTGLEASSQGIKHKVSVIWAFYPTNGYSLYIENIAKDSDGMYYRDHENRWSL